MRRMAGDAEDLLSGLAEPRGARVAAVASLAARLRAAGGPDGLVDAYYFDRERLEASARHEAAGTGLPPVLLLDAAVGWRLRELGSD